MKIQQKNGSMNLFQKQLLIFIYFQYGDINWLHGDIYLFNDQGFEKLEKINGTFYKSTNKKDWVKWSVINKICIYH